MDTIDKGFKQQKQTQLKRIMSGFYRWLASDIDPPRAIPLSDFERISYEVRIGDVLLIEGRTRISRIIRAVTLSPWTHAVLYIGRLANIEDPKLYALAKASYSGNESDQLILETVLGKGTVISPLSIYKKEHIRICRPRALARKDAINILAFSLKRLGSEYNVRHILDLARFLFPWGLLPKRWRSSLFNHNADVPTKQICSAMIAEAFYSVRFPILPLIHKQPDGKIELIPRNTRLYTPSDFDYSPYFEIIKYPFFELSERTVYHDLPWNQDGVISDDDAGLYIPPTKVNSSDGSHA